MSAAGEHQPGVRARTGELISAGCALLLAPIMFVLDWYGTVGLPRSRRSGIESAENAWRVLTYSRWLLLAAIAMALGSIVLHISQRSHGNKTDTSLLTAGVGTLAAGTLVYRVLIDLPEPSSVVDIKVGAYLGLLAAIGIALGGYESIREQRARRGRVVRRARGRETLASPPPAR